jgi:hypothetical protein
MAIGLSTGVLHSSPSTNDSLQKSYVPPVVFQAAGPNVASIQAMVDQFRTALGGVNNLNAPGPLDTGRREINWDGGGSTATAIAASPFAGFLNTRGALFTTPGTGFVQAPVDGLVNTFGNPSFATIFQPFSPVRLFSAIDSNVTQADFFIPGGGDIPAVTAGFGALFTDVDEPNGQRTHGSRNASTFIFYYSADGRLLYSSAVPASPGDASLSFLGVVFPDARIAKVVIKSGETELGSHPEGRRDVVVMDDFIFGEPKQAK